MTFSQASEKSYSRIQAALGQLLREPHELSTAMESSYALLVLETPNDSAGFVVVDGKPRDQFEAAYSAFKRLYRHKHSSWKDKSVSFIVCRSEQQSSEDADYINGLEMDAYFCRKYVVRVPESDDELADELLRLPFVPLMHASQRGAARPAAAQTLLQAHGLSAQLARQIVVPNTLSAARLVEQSLESPDALPSLRSAPATRSAPPPVISPTRTRLKELTIESFRVYKQRQVFDLDADIVVLFGPNGLGKTSFFDALDYVCTGRIGRLCRRRMEADYFRKIAGHLSSPSSEGSVTMEVRRDESTWKISRSISDWGTAFVGDAPKDRTEVLQFLTSAQWGDSKVRIENLERVFRATHLFSQVGPELLVGFDETSTLSADIVARTLALDDYAAGLAKCGDVLETLEGRDDDLQRLLREITGELGEVRRQIGAFSAVTQSLQVGEKLTQLAEQLILDLRSAAGVDVAGREVSSDAAREWRALIDSTLRDTRHRMNVLRTLQDGFAQYEKDKANLQQVAETQEVITANLGTYDADRRAQDTAARSAASRLAESRSLLEEAQLKQRQVSECLDTQTVARSIGAALLQWRQELGRVESDALSATTNIQREAPNAEALRGELGRLNEMARLGAQRILALESMRDEVAAWEGCKLEIVRLEQVEVRNRLDLQDAQASLARLEPDIAVQLSELSSKQRAYDALAENQSELMRLLDEIEMHVSDGTCPVCGIDHQDKDTLLARVRAQKATRPEYIDVLATQVRELRSSLQEAEGHRDAFMRRRNDAAAELKIVLSELAAQRENVAEFSHKLEAGGIASSAPNVEESIVAQLNAERDAVDKCAGLLRGLGAQLTGVSTRIAELESRISTLNEARERANEAIRMLESQLAQQHSRSRALGLSLDVERDELERIRDEWATKAREHNETNERLLAEARVIAAAVATADAGRREMMAQSAVCDASKRDLERKLRAYEDTAVSVLGTRQLGSDFLAESRNEASDRESVLEGLSRRIIILEGALDAAQRTAMAAKLDSDLAQLTKRNDDVAAKRRDIRKATDWFSRVRELLTNENKTAVEKHVRAFGPLTTMIQKRVRPVFGFGDIQIMPKGTEIGVDVRWQTKSVKPTDFFSDSQKQILMLSVFLSGRLTQTWSSFAPILLDDPVTHFDDLNAYSFVELIRGLVCESSGERQFIISTCEERLFELMRRKFAGLQGGARFYKFLHVNDSGPAIEELKPATG